MTFTPTVAPAYSGTMTVTSDDPSNPATTVTLSGPGLEPPQFAVDPTVLAADLLTGESEQQTLTFTNTAAPTSSSTWRWTSTPRSPSTSTWRWARTQVDANAGAPVLEGSGGPDVYGYRWIDSDEPGGPTYDWIDISATGTPVFTGVADDQNSGPFPIGFDFPFYGEHFSDFRVCSNGWLSFSSTSTSLSNQLLPNTGAPENLLAAFWDDLRVDADAGNNVYYLYDGARLIVQYEQVPRYSSGGPYTFQVLLYPDGTVVYQYADMQGTRLNEATIGLQNDAAGRRPDRGLQHGLRARRSGHPAAGLPRVADRVADVRGVVPPGGSLPVTASFNASGLFGGTYAADIMVANNDPAAPNLAVPAAMHVTGAPDIALEPDGHRLRQCLRRHADPAQPGDRQRRDRRPAHHRLEPGQPGLRHRPDGARDRRADAEPDRHGALHAVDGRDAGRASSRSRATIRVPRT